MAQEQFRRGFCDLFIVPSDSFPSDYVAVEAELDATDPLYLVNAETGSSFVNGFPYRLKPSDTDAIHLGGIAPPGLVIKPDPDYKPVSRGNSNLITAYTLAFASPVWEFGLVYNGDADIEAYFELSGGSNNSPPLLYSGSQSDSANLFEPQYSLLCIEYNYFVKTKIRLRLAFTGIFEASDYVIDTGDNGLKMIEARYRLLPGLVAGVPRSPQKQFGSRWVVNLLNPSVILAWS